MTSACMTLPSALGVELRPPRGWLANVVTIARRELRDALRSRWLLLYTLAFAALGLGVSLASAASVGGAGLAGFGRTTAGLINLVLLIVPLMSLTAGAGAIAGDRERGMLAFLLTQPISRGELVLGKFLGLALALTASVSLGFAACAGVLAWQRAGASTTAVGSTNVSGLLLLVWLTLMLAWSMLGVGMLLSTLARRANVATGTAIFVWLALVFATDLGLMAAALTFRISIERLFFLAMLNPMQVFKMWSLGAIDASLDVLGPAGLYGQQTYGSSLSWMFGAVFVAWTLLPLAGAVLIFRRSSVT